MSRCDLELGILIDRGRVSRQQRMELRSKISYAVTIAALSLLCGITFVVAGSYGWAAFGVGTAVLVLVAVYRDLGKLSTLEEADSRSEDEQA
jgi:hypothetical protein